jgi:hypothetical protein
MNAHALVDDGKLKYPVLLFDPDPGFPGAGMFGNIPQSFLDDAIETDGNFRRRRGNWFRREPDVDSLMLAEFRTMTPKRRYQSEMLQYCRMELMGHATKIVRQAFRTLAEIEERLAELS